MPPRERELEGTSVQLEGCPQQAAVADVGAAKVRRTIDAVRHLSPWKAAADVHHVVVVDVQNDRAVGLHILQQLPFRLGDLLDRSEELDVHRSDVRVDADIGMREASQHGDLAFVVHAHLADHHFGIVQHVVETEGCTDQIIEVAP